MRVGWGEKGGFPRRFPLGRWGFGVEHRRIPVGKPDRNGVVERYQGAIEENDAGEVGGVEAWREV
ncbi:hypothetical protein [Thermoflexus sp.]|uniref:hypothetical protein n=1 Tax=Thermoflexus sp. TaxID=1969742 RepID=UPI0035E4645A